MLCGHDGGLIATGHNAVDWPMFQEHAALIADGREVFEVEPGRVVRA